MSTSSIRYGNSDAWNGWDSSPVPETPSASPIPPASVVVNGVAAPPTEMSPREPGSMLVGELSNRGLFQGSPFLAPGADWRASARDSMTVASTAPTPGATAVGGPGVGSGASPPPEGAQGPGHKFFTSSNILGHILSGVGLAVAAGSAMAGQPIGMAGGSALMRAGGDISNKEEANIEYAQAKEAAGIKATKSGDNVYHPPIAQVMEQGGVAAWQGPGVYAAWQAETRKVIESNPSEYAYMAPSVELPYEAQLAARGAKTNNMKQSMDLAKMFYDSGNTTMANELMRAVYGTTQVGEVRIQDRMQFTLDEVALQSVPDGFVAALAKKDVSYPDIMKIIENLRILKLRDPNAADRVSKEIEAATPGTAEKVYEDAYARETAVINARNAARKGDKLDVPDIPANAEITLNKDPAYKALMTSIQVTLGGEDPRKIHARELRTRITQECVDNGWTPSSYASLLYWDAVSYTLGDLKNMTDEGRRNFIVSKQPKWLEYIDAWNDTYGYPKATFKRDDPNEVVKSFNEYLGRLIEQNKQSEAPKS